MKAVLRHPYENMNGNLLWSGCLPSEHHQALAASLDMVRKRGYWASAFPEGDGVVFSKDGYTLESGFADFRECFSFIHILEAQPGKSVGDQLAEAAAESAVMCRYLVPVTGLRLDEPFAIGATKFHPPVDGDDWQLSDHPWGEHLCDEPGADVCVNWVPGKKATGTTALLGYPLIERSISVPAPLLHRSYSSIKGHDALLQFVIEDADHALDLVRYAFCSYKKLEYLPNKAGWIGEFADAYVMPEDSGFKWQYVTAKPSVMRVTNNWLGLLVGSEASSSIAWPLAEFVDGGRTDEIGVQIKAALRAFGRAFYLVDLEAAFLHILYAIDALCGPGRLVGKRQRIWICACACGGNGAQFQDLLLKYDASYIIRNSIVHKGKSFVELGQKGAEHAQFMQDVLGLAIRNIVSNGFETRQEIVGMILGRLQSPDIQVVVAAYASSEITLPIVNDRVFKHVIRYQTTE
jgi:hypothetical protein